MSLLVMLHRASLRICHFIPFLLLLRPLSLPCSGLERRVTCNYIYQELRREIRGIYGSEKIGSKGVVHTDRLERVVSLAAMEGEIGRTTPEEVELETLTFHAKGSTRQVYRRLGSHLVSKV
jgi:hypothetical protein